MPELAEVEFYRKQWNLGLNQSIQSIHINSERRIFREGNPQLAAQRLPSSILKESQCSGKWMLFKFQPTSWLGIHLGMTGTLSTAAADYSPLKHDHLVLYQKKQSLIFSDPRLFGRIRFEQTHDAPLWWLQLAPSLISPEVKLKDISAFLKNHARSPIKAALLMQKRFPGIGNWMADEILWRASIHPRRLAGSLSPLEEKILWKETLTVVRNALKVIGNDWSDPPNSWLFNHRWKDGGLCPATVSALLRETIGGRTTCWSPGRQKI
ncbi:MAG: DNA-formamidopyrimidine glycosylase family protein [Blastochloris sp.]|nr:DNA-formamidopyrimidine glycosylase family protein [Blastochloris sp.]